MIEFPNKKYQVIYADPPWNFSSKLKSSKLEENGKAVQHKLIEKYQTMRIKDICELPIKEIADETSVLLMWTTDAHLEEAMKVINAWGYKYKTVGFIWNKKEKTGKQVCFMGQWTMKGSEICLLATRGKAHSLLKVRNIRQLIEAPRGKHSEKPQEARERIDKLFGDIPKIELFARQEIEGWDCWGNEVNNEGAN